MKDKDHKKDHKIMIKNIHKSFPGDSIIKNNIFHELLRVGGYYTNYSLINPMNYVLKSALPFIPFEKLKKRFF